MSLKEKVTFNVHTGLDPVCRQRGPYEASEGIYPGRGQGKKLGAQAKIGR